MLFQNIAITLATLSALTSPVYAQDAAPAAAAPAVEVPANPPAAASPQVDYGWKYMAIGDGTVVITKAGRLFLEKERAERKIDPSVAIKVITIEQDSKTLNFTFKECVESLATSFDSPTLCKLLGSPEGYPILVLQKAAGLFIYEQAQILKETMDSTLPQNDEIEGGAAVGSSVGAGLLTSLITRNRLLIGTASAAAGVVGFSVTKAGLNKLENPLAVREEEFLKMAKDATFEDKLDAVWMLRNLYRVNIHDQPIVDLDSIYTDDPSHEIDDLAGMLQRTLTISDVLLDRITPAQGALPDTTQPGYQAHGDSLLSLGSWILSAFN